MITITIDAILQAVMIERLGKENKLYCPSPASIRRVLRLTCQLHKWVYVPTFYQDIFKWVRRAV